MATRRKNLERRLNRMKKVKMVYRGKGRLRGSGHNAGEDWGEKKEINPKSTVRKYSKNSPSFDQGVMKYKMRKIEEKLNKRKLDLGTNND